MALNGGVFGEVGLRRYMGLLSGAFVGIPVLGGTFLHRCEDSSTTRNENAYGLAGDVGYQWVTRHGVVVGIGAGAQIQRSVTACKVGGTELERPVVVPSVTKTGVLPRLQFAIGYHGQPNLVVSGKSSGLRSRGVEKVEVEQSEAGHEQRSQHLQWKVDIFFAHPSGRSMCGALGKVGIQTRYSN